MKKGKNKLLMLTMGITINTLQRAYSRSYLIAIIAVALIIVLAAGYSFANSLDNTQTTNLSPSALSTSTVESTSSTAGTSGTPTSCQSCITISTVYLNVESQSMSSDCWNMGTTVLTQYLGEVIAPNATGSSRTFSYSFYVTYNDANNMMDGAFCNTMANVLSMTLSNSQSLPFEIVSVTPTLPVSMNAGSQMEFTLSFDSSSGSYSGPVTIIMTVQ